MPRKALDGYGRWNSGPVNVDAHPKEFGALHDFKDFMEKRERRAKKKKR